MSLVSLRGDQSSVPSGDRKREILLRRPCLELLSPCSAIPIPPAPIQRSAQPQPTPALQVRDLGPGSLCLPGVALTSGSGAAARAHGPLKKRWPVAHRRPGRPGSAPWAPDSRPRRALLVLARDWRAKGLVESGRGRSWVRSAEPRRSDSLRHQVPSGAQPPPLTRAAGSSPWRRRPRTAEGRGQRQQIGELLGRRAQVSAQSHRTRDGEQGSRPGPPRLSTSPWPTGTGLHFPAVSAGPLPPRARHHGAPAQRLASAALRRPSAPRGAQPSSCEGEFPAGCAPQPPSLHP
jgi:hypothetical protein